MFEPSEAASWTKGRRSTTENAMEYEFNLIFKLASEDVDDERIMEALGGAGCTDALACIGLPGFVRLDFIREAGSKEEAMRSAVCDANAAIPKAVLLEDRPGLCE